MANEQNVTPAKPAHGSKFDASKLIRTLAEKWHGKPCPMCDSGPWSVGTEVFELREFHGGSFVLGAGKLMPVIGITCENCGNTIFVNAIKAGAVEKEGQ